MPSFADLTEQFLQREFEESPVRASGLGLTDYDDRLDDLSEAAFAARRRRNAAWLERFAPLEEEALAPDERIDRDLVVSVLRGRAVMADWEMWRRQPDVYLTPGLAGVFTLFLHRLRPEAELARSAAARLRAVPRLVEDGIRNLRPELAPRAYVERALGQARAGARYARELVAAEVADATLRAELAAAGAVAAAAFDRFTAFLEALRGSARGEYAIGEAR